MKALKNILLFILKSAVIAASVFLSRIGAGRDDKSENSEKPPRWKKILRPAGIIDPVVIIVAAVVICAPILTKDVIGGKNEVRSVKADVAGADEIVTYENSGDLYGDPMFDTDIYRDSMLLDYDKMTVTFLYRMNYCDYKQVQLTEDGFLPDENHILQFKQPLRDGGEVRVYYDKNGDGTSLRPSFKTCAVTVENDGKVYGAHFDSEPLGFESCLDDLYALEERGLETKVYRNNELPSYAGNVKSDTLFFDPENRRIYSVYLDTSGFGVANVRLEEWELVETEKIENVFIQAEFDLQNGNKLYAYGNEDYTEYASDPILKWQLTITDGLALKYNGKLYKTEFGVNRNRHDFMHSTGAVDYRTDCTSIVRQ